LFRKGGQSRKMSIKTKISLGEFLDKLSILEIKKRKIKEKNKLQNINKEHALLVEQWQKSKYASEDISIELLSLKQANQALWEIEDKIRDKEAKGVFDKEFIELARSVYLTNDKRSKIKKTLNEKLNSDLIEEKSYKEC
jgi:hypothetical protein